MAVEPLCTENNDELKSDSHMWNFTIANFSEIEGFPLSSQHRLMASITVYAHTLHLPSLENPVRKWLELVYGFKKKGGKTPKPEDLKIIILKSLTVLEVITSK